eukprot:scaffold70325_cov66-Phaeocystis_antarctica.AAC.1
MLAADSEVEGLPSSAYAASKHRCAAAALPRLLAAWPSLTSASAFAPVRGRGRGAHCGGCKESRELARWHAARRGRPANTLPYTSLATAHILELEVLLPLGVELVLDLADGVAVLVDALAQLVALLEELQVGLLGVLAAAHLVHDHAHLVLGLLGDGQLGVLRLEATQRAVER